MRIAMWSGPRSLSTALMYSFAARGDCAVWDEPFYGAWLEVTGLEHPLRDEVMRQVETDPQRIAAKHVGDIPGGKPHFYFKEMAHHMFPNMPRDWFPEVTHVFLIRHPARVITSYLSKREKPTAEEIGFAHQAVLFDELTRLTGREPAVIDASDIRADPRSGLKKLCDRIDLSFTEKMLRWPRGGHVDDGPWGSHWYGAVRNSTGFEAAEGPLPELPAALRSLCEQAMPVYERLRRSSV